MSFAHMWYDGTDIHFIQLYLRYSACSYARFVSCQRFIVSRETFCLLPFVQFRLLPPAFRLLLTICAFFGLLASILFRKLGRAAPNVTTRKQEGRQNSRAARVTRKKATAAVAVARNKTPTCSFRWNHLRRKNLSRLSSNSRIWRSKTPLLVTQQLWQHAIPALMFVHCAKGTIC